MAEYDVRKPYEVKPSPRTVELIEMTTVQGQPVKKITVFDRNPATGSQPVIVAHILRDARDRVICSATITAVHYDRATGAVVPQRVTLVCPSQQVELKMKLDNIRVAPIPPYKAATLFSRRNLASQRSFDLAAAAHRLAAAGPK